MEEGGHQKHNTVEGVNLSTDQVLHLKWLSKFRQSCAHATNVEVELAEGPPKPRRVPSGSVGAQGFNPAAGGFRAKVQVHCGRVSKCVHACVCASARGGPKRGGTHSLLGCTGNVKYL